MSSQPEMSEATKAKYKKTPVYQGVFARFPRALKEIAKVSVFGTNKHQVPLSDMSYMDIPNAYVIYTDATARHLVNEAIEGPINHEDGDLLHPAQLAWDALARLEIYLRDQEVKVEEPVDCHQSDCATHGVDFGGTIVYDNPCDCVVSELAAVVAKSDVAISLLTAQNTPISVGDAEAYTLMTGKDYPAGVSLIEDGHKSRYEIESDNAIANALGGGMLADLRPATPGEYDGPKRRRYRDGLVDQCVPSCAGAIDNYAADVARAANAVDSARLKSAQVGNAVAVDASVEASGETE